MRLQHFLALTASVGLASAKKCKPKSSLALTTTSSDDIEVPTSSYGSFISVDSSTSLEPSYISEPSTLSESTTISDITASETVISETSTGSFVLETSTGSFVSEASTGSFIVSDTTASEITISGTTTSSETTSETASMTSATSTSPPEPTQICQARGSRAMSAISSSTKLLDNTYDGCRALCETQSGCQSFSIQIQTGGACSLYDSLVYIDFTPGTTGATIFFDADCPVPVVSGPTIVPYSPPGGPVPTGSVPSSAGPVVQLPEFTPPSVVSSDSPPYVPSGPQSKPADDNEFTATYTYTQYQLPSVIAEGHPPLTTGVPRLKGPQMPCMMTAGEEHPFTVVNEDFMPMVSRTGSVGPLLQPTEAPSADDPILNPLSFTLPSFHLKEVAGASDVYDMVYGETGQFVAMTTDGEVILVDASTGTSFSGDHVTSIFSFDCRGTIFITQGGSKYTWTTSGQSCSIVAEAAPKNNIKVLPVSVPKLPELQDRKRATELIEKLKARRAIKGRVNTDFSAPQCPNAPTGVLVSKTKPGYEMGEGNFCEDLNDWWGLSPFDFDTACEIQSLCFDQCEDFSFAGCTAIFSYAMYFSCADNFESWWDVAKAAACAIQASVFTGLAATETGQRLYQKAQDSMCGCFCSSPPDTCVYLDDKGEMSDDFYCANIKSNDMLNCGACGRQCGANSACRSGVCGCPQDQCGTTCLDFRNNPNHCGACDNACSPPYCIGGQCYAPTPDQCAPDQGVTNNMFADISRGFVNWTIGAFPGSALGSDVEFGASRYTYDSTKPAVTAISVAMHNLPGGGHHAMLTHKRVKMCPGFNYELQFNMGYVNQVDGAGVESNADCRVRWLTGVPGSPHDAGAFRASDWYNIGVSNSGYMTFGPWRLGSVRDGEPGVTLQKANLYIDLTAVISCTTPQGGHARFIITDVQMNPVGFVGARGEDGEGLPAVLEQRGDGVKTTNGSALLVEEYPLGPVVEESFVKGSARRMRR